MLRKLLSKRLPMNTIQPRLSSPFTPRTFGGRPAQESNAKMHHRRIRLTVQSIFPGPKPGQTAGPGGRRLHRRCDLKTDQMFENSDKRCHVEGTERASGGEHDVRSASSSWNDEKCGGWTLGCMSTASGGGETGVRLSQSEETLAHRMCYKTLPGDIFFLTLTMDPRDLFVAPTDHSVGPADHLFQHG